MPIASFESTVNPWALIVVDISENTILVAKVSIGSMPNWRHLGEWKQFGKFIR
jgi:hypothetical protein